MIHRRRPHSNFRQEGPSKIGKKIALMQCILNRPVLDEAAINSLVNGFGHSEAEVRAMVAEELQRRQARANA